MSILERFIAAIALILLLPVWITLFFLVTLTSPGPFLFKQKRVGKNGKVFEIYKVRTMVIDAEKLKNYYQKSNEADGPVFKIKEDPRYTHPGKYIAHLGLDELPQLLNILKGEMAFVGPRPLPINEVKKIPLKYKKRHQILPGITSLWVIRGSHKLKFREWMQSDIEYLNKKSPSYDIYIILQTFKVLFKALKIKIIKKA